MVSKACAELSEEGRNEMQNIEEASRSKRQLKRALIVLAVVEFIVTAFVVGRYVVQN